MNAKAALRQSKGNLIESDVRNGFIVIFQDYNASENFHLYFMPRVEEKDRKSAEMVKIRLHDDLDTAVTIASIGYGAYDSKWKPLDQVHLDSLTEILKMISDPI